MRVFVSSVLPVALFAVLFDQWFSQHLARSLLLVLSASMAFVTVSAHHVRTADPMSCFNHPSRLWHWRGERPGALKLYMSSALRSLSSKFQTH